MPRIDTEMLINSPYSTNGWLDIGRQGGIFTRWLLGMAHFNPFFAIIGGYLLICVASVLFAYLFWRAAGDDSIIYSAFGLILFTCPIMAEQFYFDMQILMVAWAYILCAGCVGLSYYGILRRKLLPCLAAGVGMIWMFSTYQIFTVLYVVAAVTCFILLYCRWTLEQGREDMPCWRLVAGLSAMFIFAFAANTLITNSFFINSGYLQGQIMWGKVPTETNIGYIRSHIEAAVSGDGIFYTRFYGPLAVLTLVSMLIQVCRRRARCGYLAVLAVLGLQVSPFLLTIYLGVSPAIRAQLAYPMVLACDVILLFRIAPKHKLARAALGLLTVALCWTQTLNTELLIYTDQVRAHEDMRLASYIEQRIVAVSDLEKPIAFVGVYDNQLNANCVRGDIIGMSAFNCNSDESPHYSHSTNRACNLSKTYGFPFIPATEEQVFQARSLALEMPSWPEEGSVADAGEFTIVKLSEDNWTEEITEAYLVKLSSEEASELIGDNSLMRVVDSVDAADGQLQISGWAIIDEVDSKATEHGVFLHHEQSGEYYRMFTAKKLRPDLAAVFESPLYKYGGFYAAAPVAALEEPLDGYTLYVGLKYGNQWHISPANTELPATW